MNEQTSLNAIALSVALLSFSVLLGPYLNLPAAVPAVITLSVLVLAAVDTFGFNGLGSRLLLDGFSQLSPAHRQRVIHHEAGHFLTAQLLGAPVVGYTLTAWEAFRQGHSGEGGVRVETPDFGETITASELERYCTIWMAGGVAESLVYENVEGGADDLKTLRSVLTQLEVRDAVLKERVAGRRAQQLLQTHWETYEELVVAMTQRASVEDCCRLIAQRAQSTV
ncbi:MAG: hypothetical protein AAF329_18150 [Cyanobacteria bacterium P01_A01_bin.17]